ncbi:hypothetical protein JAAARDRAFT_661148 [Jaapia argillacea MUCL 33604]|uniref:Uncharacterized protein n=1 Tax=Jaapia argillacea MUCL 33604 TaxID=933084 RepID=A0A067P660_9AGAM|nr:hypothetical protein JAAARDRAFT_661148 [Jaapia argillacea MUCL 33604]
MDFEPRRSPDPSMSVNQRLFICRREVACFSFFFVCAALFSTNGKGWTWLQPRLTDRIRSFQKFLISCLYMRSEKRVSRLQSSGYGISNECKMLLIHKAACGPLLLTNLISRSRILAVGHAS